RGLEAIPGDNLKTAVDEAYTAFGGLGPELSRIVRGGSSLAIDARNHLDELTNIVDNVAPLLDTQTDTADSVQAWAAHLATVSRQLQDKDDAVQGILREGPAATGQVRDLLDRVQPTIPILLSNLTNIGPVLVTYHDGLEQLLVLLPQGTAMWQATGTANRNTKQAFNGLYLDFNLNLNLPPPCTTGFLPSQQQRASTFEDYPKRPPGDLYCRIPQDAMNDVRGARNTPCVTRPGKRAPTVAMCESDEQYVPLNDGMNWKGDPNATYTGQDIPQLPPGSPPRAAPAPPAAPAPIAVAEYDPNTGSYVGPDGRMYTDGDLARNSGPGRTWQSLLLPPPGN
ncbi:MAG: MCE family protein, partial [Mycobacterium sp.]